VEYRLNIRASGGYFLRPCLQSAYLFAGGDPCFILPCIPRPGRTDNP
jgi:hypothetical protein